MMVKGKKAVVMIYLTLIIFIIIVVLIGAIAAPLGSLFNAELYKAGEQILLDANSSIQGIQNDTVRQNLQSSFNTALGNAQDNIDLTNDFYAYSWILILFLAALMVFMFTRSLTERTGCGFV